MAEHDWLSKRLMFFLQRREKSCLFPVAIVLNCFFVNPTFQLEHYLNMFVICTSAQALYSTLSSYSDGQYWLLPSLLCRLWWCIFELLYSLLRIGVFARFDINIETLADLRFILSNHSTWLKAVILFAKYFITFGKSSL